MNGATPFVRNFRTFPAALASAILLALTVHAAQAQTFKVIYNFTGGQDGAYPTAGLTMDKAGSLYGTTSAGGYMGGGCASRGGCGTVFKLKYSGSAWLLSPLYNFGGPPDGFDPQARVVFGPEGSLYGTTFMGGSQGGGTVFNLRPPAAACRNALCPWTETVLYRFTGGIETGPLYGDLIFDLAGNIYGTTWRGGSGEGSVFMLTPSNGGWTEADLYDFNGPPGGIYPYSGVILDQAGNLYGTTSEGGLYGLGKCGDYCGEVFKLTHSESGWIENHLYDFRNGSDGAYPESGVIFDQAGNLYGATVEGGSGHSGTIYELSPSNGGWMLTILYSLVGSSATLSMDSAGSLYGTTGGSVFKLTLSNGGWTYTDLHDFKGGSDGGNADGSILVDANGNLYGTATSGGAYSYGVVWEITP
jgi:uncharacterized repeat protein (TIGR03803 family)